MLTDPSPVRIINLQYASDSPQQRAIDGRGYESRKWTQEELEAFEAQTGLFGPASTKRLKLLAYAAGNIQARISDDTDSDDGAWL